MFNDNRSTKDPKSQTSFQDVKDKLQEKIDKISSHESVAEFQNFAMNNKADTAACLFIVLGIILSFFNSMWGGAIVGVVVGIYFSDELMRLASNVNETMNQQGIAKSLIFSGLLLIFFIAYPLLFVACACAVAITQLLRPSKSKADQ